MSSCISDEFCLCYVFDLNFSSVFLRLSHHYFYLKVKEEKKKKTYEKIVELSPFLSSFSAFLYETAAMSRAVF